jgi:hypothetical protein
LQSDCCVRLQKLPALQRSSALPVIHPGNHCTAAVRKVFKVVPQDFDHERAVNIGVVARQSSCDFRHIPTSPFRALCHADFSLRTSRLPDPAAGFRSIQKAAFRAEEPGERSTYRTFSTVAERSQFLERTERFRPAPAS